LTDILRRDELITTIKKAFAAAFNCNMPVYEMATKDLRALETASKDVQTHVRKMPPETTRNTNEDLL
jgi:hypothetical protein